MVLGDGFHRRLTAEDLTPQDGGPAPSGLLSDRRQEGTCLRPEPPRTRVGGLNFRPEPPNDSRAEGRLMEWGPCCPPEPRGAVRLAGQPQLPPGPVCGAPGLAGRPGWRAGRGATRPEPAASWAGCRRDALAQGLYPASLDVTLPGNGGPDGSLEEVGLGRGHWAESGCTQGGVGGASTRGGMGGRARDRGAPPRPLRFLQSGCIEPGAPSPREQSPRPPFIFSAQGPGGRDEQKPDAASLPAPSPSGPPFSSLYNVF